MALTKTPIELSSTPGIVDNSNNTAITIDSNENVGIGTTPKSGWVNNAVQLGTNLSLSEDANSAYLSANAYASSTGWKRVNNQLAGYIRMGTNDGVFSFSNAVTGAADSVITWQERFSITSAGNVGIGTAAPTSRLQLDGAEDRTGGLTLSAGGQNHTYFLSSDFVNVHNIETSSGAAAHTWQTNGTERMRITSAGNVGVGTSIPYNNSKLDVLGSIISTSQTIGTYAADNAGFDFAAATKVGRFFSTSSDATGGHMTFITGAGAGLERMRIDSAGTTMLSHADGAANLGRIQFSTQATTYQILGGNNIGYMGYKTGGYHRWFGSDTAEKMRLNSAGNLLVGTTNGSGGITLHGEYANQGLITLNTTATSADFIYFVTNANVVGKISSTATATAYVTSSDYRLKEDDVPMTGATERVKALRPINFAWKVDGSRVDGFLAHEVQDVVPEAITGAKDAMRDEEYEVTPAVLDDDGNVTTEAVMGTRSVPDYQGIDQSKLVPLLVATIQELEARLTALENN